MYIMSNHEQQPRQVIFGRSPRIGFNSVEEFQAYIDESKSTEKIVPVAQPDIIQQAEKIAKNEQEWIYNMNA